MDFEQGARSAVQLLAHVFDCSSIAVRLPFSRSLVHYTLALSSPPVDLRQLKDSGVITIELLRRTFETQFESLRRFAGKRMVKEMPEIPSISPTI